MVNGKSQYQLIKCVWKGLIWLEQAIVIACEGINMLSKRYAIVF
jgi:hypothetical protein